MHDLQGVTRRPRRRSDQRGERAERRRMRGGKDDVCVCVVCVCAGERRSDRVL